MFKIISKHNEQQEEGKGTNMEDLLLDIDFGATEIDVDPLEAEEGETKRKVRKSKLLSLENITLDLPPELDVFLVPLSFCFSSSSLSFSFSVPFPFSLLFAFSFALEAEEGEAAGKVRKCTPSNLMCFLSLFLFCLFCFLFLSFFHSSFLSFLSFLFALSVLFSFSFFLLGKSFILSFPPVFLRFSLFSFFPFL